MRKLHKEMPPPDVLQRNQQSWTEEYARNPKNFSRYRHEEVRAELKQETLDKCAYCESRIEDVAPPHVEHILPKTARPDLVVDWRNLTLACPNCNYNKGTYYSTSAPLLNPYTDDPVEHLRFTGALVFPKDGSKVGERTINKVKLQRDALLQSREQRIKAVSRLLHLWHEASAEDKEMYRDLLLEEAGPDREFSEAVRAWLLDMGFDAADEMADGLPA